MKRSALCCMLWLTACSAPGDPEAPAVTARPDEPPIAAGSLKTEATIANGPNLLVVKPGHVFACGGRDQTAATITWSSTDPDVKSVTITVQAPQDPAPKVFTKGGSEGSAETGNWIAAGVKISMADSVSGRELAAHTIKAYPCQ